MIIDAHNHPDWHGYNLDDYLENMKENGIDKTWLLSWETPRDEYNPRSIRTTPHVGEHGPIPFSGCVSYIERAPDKFILGYAPDPRKPEAIDQLRSAVAIYNVRIYGELKLRMMYDNPDAIRMFRVCGELKLPVTVHIDYEFDTGSTYPRPNYWYGGGIDAFERAIKLCPETVFLGHAPGFWAHISGDDKFDKVIYPDSAVKPGGRIPELLDKYPNLYCDLSANSALGALKRDPGFAKKFLVQYQDRILFARDCFNSRLKDFLDALNLSEEIMDKICSKNALKLVPVK